MNTDLNRPSKINEQTDDEIDLLALLFVLLRGWKVILILTLIGLAIGWAYGRYINPVYESNALIQIENNSQGLPSLAGGNITSLLSSSGSLAQKEAKLIKSRRVLKPVIDLLHLDISLSNPSVGFFDRIKSDSISTQSNTKEGVLLETSDGQIKVSHFEVSKDYLGQAFTLSKSNTGFILSNGFEEFKGQFNTASRFIGSKGSIQIVVNELPNDKTPIKITKQTFQATTNAIENALKVEEVGSKTGVVELTFTGSNQQQVSTTLNQVIQTYIQLNEAKDFEETTNTIEFMEEQLPNLQDKLEASEARFNDFREKNGTIDVGQEASLLVAENSRIDSQLSELNLKKADLTTYYTEEHPLVVQIDEQINVLNARKRDIKNDVGRLPDMQREFLKLSEETTINREVYLTMLKNYEQLKIVRAGQISNVRVIDLPIDTYKVVAPKKLLILILGLLVGAMLGILIVLLKSLIRNTVKDSSQLESKTGIPVAATISRSASLLHSSRSKNVSNRLLADVDQNSRSYESLKTLRTYLMSNMSKKDPSIKQQAQIVLITGEKSGVGTSFIAANLTEVFAQLNKNVLIIDADMRGGDLHSLFKVEESIGLADCLSQSDQSISTNDDISKFIYPTSLDFIDIMPRGHYSLNSSSLLARDVFSDMISWLSTVYDYIVIDSPSVLTASDATVLAQFADQVLMVTRYNKSVEGQVAYAVKQMHKASIQVDGIILNDVQQSIISKYGYAYGSNN